MTETEKKIESFTNLGRKFALWKTRYQENAYKDQFGRQHPAFIVEKEWLVTVSEVRPVKGMFGDGTHEGMKAVAEDGTVFTCNWTSFADDSMSPTYLWGGEGVGSPSYVMDAIIDSNHGHQIFIREDGTRAVPKGARFCEKHDYYFMNDAECFRCRYG